MKKTVVSFAVLLLLGILLAIPAFAATGMTSGGDAGVLKITYYLNMSPNDAYATTSAESMSPNPNLSTYLEARYWDAGSGTYRVAVDSGTTYASCNPSGDIISAKSVHTANSGSTAWGYFGGELIKP